MTIDSSQEKVFMGVDVSKFTLDFYSPDDAKSFQIENSEAAIQTLCVKLTKAKRPVMVVMEATGGYESLLVNSLAKHSIEAAVVNPRQVRDFAKGIGRDAKTDAIDAQVISQFGAIVKPQPMAAQSDHQRKHGALVVRRNQLLRLVNKSRIDSSKRGMKMPNEASSKCSIC